jgi:hypothetical protein
MRVWNLTLMPGSDDSVELPPLPETAAADVIRMAMHGSSEDLHRLRSAAMAEAERSLDLAA